MKKISKKKTVGAKKRMTLKQRTPNRTLSSPIQFTISSNSDASRVAKDVTEKIAEASRFSAGQYKPRSLIENKTGDEIRALLKSEVVRMTKKIAAMNSLLEVL